MNRIDINGEIVRDGSNNKDISGEIPIFEPPKEDIKSLTKNVGAKGIEKQTKLVRARLLVKTKGQKAIEDDKDR